MQDIILDDLAVDRFHLPQLLHALGQETPVVALRNRSVDHLLQSLGSKGVQVLIKVLANVVQEGADLLVIDDPYGGDCLACGEDQAVETHRHGGFQPGKDPDGFPGGIALPEHIVGGLHQPGHLLGSGNVQAGLNGDKEGRQPVFLIGVIGGLRDFPGLLLKVKPGPQDKANIRAVPGDPAIVQDPVHHLRGRSGEDHRGVGGQ